MKYTCDDIHSRIIDKRSFLCVGLDPDLERLPTHISADPKGVVEFCQQIIEATADVAVAFKLNLAFFEIMGVKGIDAFRQITDHIPDDCLVIADAKRGDIGNSSRQYARTFFDTFPCDAVTVAPYMGEDSLTAFLEYEDKWTIILGLTSNKGSKDFQLQRLQSGEYLYEHVLSQTSQWGDVHNTMYVIGATHPQDFQNVRRLVPHHFLLVPGVGAQGATVEDVCRYGLNDRIGLLINSSRSIIFASADINYADAARRAAMALVVQMRECAPI